MDQKYEKYNLRLLRGWQRSQLELLKEFSVNPFLSQTKLSGASGLQAGSHALGGKITALVREDLIVKAGKDEDGKYLWQLNDERVDRNDLQEFLKKLKI